MVLNMLVAHFEQNVAHAEKTLCEEGTVRPLFTVIDEQGHIRPVAVDFSTEEAKDESFAMVRLICAADAAVAVFHRSEAWLVISDAAPCISASQSERRIEVLLVSCVARVDGALMWKVSIREIVRDFLGAVSSLRDIAVPGLAETGLKSMDLQGRTMNLLSTEPPTFDERRRARDRLDWVEEQLASCLPSFRFNDGDGGGPATDRAGSRDGRVVTSG